MNILNRIISISLFSITHRLSVFLNVLLLPLITPYLTLNDFAVFGIISSLLFVLTPLSQFGQNFFIDNSFYTHSSNYILVWRRCLSLMNYLSCLLVIIFTTFVFFLNELKGTEKMIIIFSGFSYLFFNSYDVLIRSYYIHNKLASLYFRFNFYKSLILAIILYFSIGIFRLGYLGWILNLGLGQFFNVLFFCNLIIKKKLYPFHFFKIKWALDNIKISFSIIPYQMARQVSSTFDRLLLKYFNLNVDLIGTYSQGYNIGYNGSSLLNGIFSSFASNLQVLFRQSNFLKIKKLHELIFSSFCFLSIIFQLWVDELFKLIFRKPEFHDASNIAGVIFSSIAFLVTYEFLNSFLAIRFDTKKIAFIAIIVASFNLIVNYVFIPIYGIYSVIYSSIFTNYLMGLSFMFYPETFTQFKKIFSLKYFFIYHVLYLFLIIFLFKYANSFSLLIKFLGTMLFLILTLLNLFKLKYERSLFNK